MILVDTSVWIDHLHRADRHLAWLLESNLVGCHRAVIEELAVGSIKDRVQTIADLDELTNFPVISHTEFLHTVDWNGLWGRGLSVVDVHLLSSVQITAGARLWTHDKRLDKVAQELGIAHTAPTQ